MPRNITITLEDGSQHQYANVPDSVTPDQVISRASQEFGKGITAIDGGNKSQQSAINPSLMQEIQGSIPGRILQGARDPIDEAAAMLPKGLQAVTSLGGNLPNRVSDFFGNEAKRVQGINKANEQEYQRARIADNSTGADVARFVGNVVSPMNAIPLSKAANTSRGLQAVKTGIASGAMGGSLTKQDVTDPNYWNNKLAETLKGAAIGGAVSPVMGGIANAVKPETSKYVQLLMKEGVTPTSGQIMGGTANALESKMQSLPITGDMITAGKKSAINQFNTAALNRALSPIGESVDTIGREGVKQVRQKLQNAYDDLLPKMSFKPDQQFNTEYANLQNMAQGLGDKERAKFTSVMNDVLSKISPNGSMDGETFKIVESKLNQEAKKFSGSADAYQKELGDALNEGLRIFRSTLPRVNPAHAEQLSKINTGWANYARLRQAASSTASGANEGVFTPAQLAMAIRMQDKTAGKGASAEGSALMQDLAEAGTNVLGSKYPDSGTAGRLLLGGGALSSAAVNPLIPAGLALGGLPFVGPGKSAMAALLTKRPANSAKLAAQLRKISPAISAAAPIMMQNREQP